MNDFYQHEELKNVTLLSPLLTKNKDKGFQIETLKAFIYGKLGKKRCHYIIDKNIKWLVWIFVLLFHYILGQIEHENLLPVQDNVPTST